MKRVLIMCLAVLVFGSVTLSAPAAAAGKGDAAEKAAKKPTPAVKAPAARKAAPAPRKPDVFIDKDKNGKNDKVERKVTKPRRETVKKPPTVRTPKKDEKKTPPGQR